MSAVDSLLARLERVRQTGPGRWIASSPTRADKHPSMTIRELDDGRILLHDFGGDSVGEILDSLGMGYSDLFPERDAQHGKPERRPFPAADILRAVAFEALVVATAGTALLSGHPFSEADRERLIVAVGRLQAAAAAGGNHHG
jgi:hypothetical protein